jgi:hypothetical protein
MCHGNQVAPTNARLFAQHLHHLVPCPLGERGQDRIAMDDFVLGFGRHCVVTLHVDMRMYVYVYV